MPLPVLYQQQGEIGGADAAVTAAEGYVAKVRARVVARHPFRQRHRGKVFKRYNIVEEKDLKAAVTLLNRTRNGAEEVQATESAPGPDSVSVDGT